MFTAEHLEDLQYKQVLVLILNSQTRDSKSDPFFFFLW